MSTGLVICSTCHREVHQYGPNASWVHCEDKTPRCDGASSVYPSSRDEIVGRYCGADEAKPITSDWQPKKRLSKDDVKTLNKASKDWKVSGGSETP